MNKRRKRIKKQINKVVSVISEILEETKLSDEELEKESNKRKQSCKLHIDFCNCSLWDLYIGCSDCKHFIKEENHDI